MALIGASFVALLAGLALLLSRLRWFQRRTPLADRLRPYAPEQVAVAEAQEWLRSQ